MRILTIIIFIAAQSFCFANKESNDKLINSIEGEYLINIYDNYNEDFFLYQWQESPLNLRASNMSEEEKELVLGCLVDVLKRYPKSLVSGTINNVYLIDSVSKEDLPISFSHNQGLYISTHNKSQVNKDTLIYKIDKSFLNIFFKYFPIYNDSIGITSDIALDFEQNALDKNVSKSLRELSSKYNVELTTNTTPAGIPIPYRQKPYLLNAPNRITKIDKNVLHILDSLLEENSLFVKQLVNNIYLINSIEYGNNILPSFSYYSNIYLSLYNKEGVIDYRNLEEQFQIQISKIVYQNIRADISIDKWSEMNIGDSISDPNEEIKTFVSLHLNDFDSLEKMSRTDNMILEKRNYFICAFDKLISKLNKISIKGIEQKADMLSKIYNINIHYNYTGSYNSENIITPGLSILSTPNPYQIDRALSNIDTALSIYPKETLNANLKNIFIVEIMLFSKKFYAPGGTYSYHDKSVYVSNVGNYDESLQMIVHHEFSSIVRHYSKIEFPKEEWLLINDSSLSYSYTNDRELPNKITIEKMRNLGFLEYYSSTCAINDIEVFTSWYFTKQDELLILSKENKKIRLKLKLINEYYEKVMPLYHFSKEIESIINQ